MRLLTTVSNVLRDSELVRDGALKQRVLQRALFVWGRLVVLLENDDNYRDYIADLAGRLADDIGMSEKKKTAFLKAMGEVAPLLTGYGGMSSTLASRKLSRSLSRSFSVEGFQDDAPSVVMGALLALAIQDDGWTNYFVTAGKKHRKVRAVQSALRGIALSAYYRQTLRREDLENLEQFLLDVHMVEVKSRDALEEKRNRDRLLGELRSNRIKHSAGRLPKGETTFSAALEEPAAPDSGDELPPERITG